MFIFRSTFITATVACAFTVSHLGCSVSAAPSPNWNFHVAAEDSISAVSSTPLASLSVAESSHSIIDPSPPPNSILNSAIATPSQVSENQEIASSDIDSEVAPSVTITFPSTFSPSSFGAQNSGAGRSLGGTLGTLLGSSVAVLYLVI